MLLTSLLNERKLSASELVNKQKPVHYPDYIEIHIYEKEILLKVCSFIIKIMWLKNKKISWMYSTKFMKLFKSIINY